MGTLLPTVHAQQRLDAPGPDYVAEQTYRFDETGRHEAVLDGSGLPSGVYLIRLVTENRTETQRLTLVR